MTLTHAGAVMIGLDVVVDGLLGAALYWVGSQYLHSRQTGHYDRTLQHQQYTHTQRCFVRLFLVRRALSPGAFLEASRKPGGTLDAFVHSLSEIQTRYVFNSTLEAPFFLCKYSLPPSS